MDKVKELGPLPDTSRSKSTASTPTRNVGYVVVCTKKVLVRFSSFLYVFLFFLSIRRPKKVIPVHLQKLRTLYDTIKDYHDTKGRQLSLIFMKLPNKNEYPDYYEVIKQPIHMEKIASTLKNNGYDNLDELVSDFILMFDNACKYNEPDSQIYKVCMTKDSYFVIYKSIYYFICWKTYTYHQDLLTLLIINKNTSRFWCKAK